MSDPQADTTSTTTAVDGGTPAAETTYLEAKPAYNTTTLVTNTANADGSFNAKIA